MGGLSILIDTQKLMRKYGLINILIKPHVSTPSTCITRTITWGGRLYIDSIEIKEKRIVLK
jgi:hypothetical protein